MSKGIEETEFLCASLISTWLDNNKLDLENDNLFLGRYSEYRERFDTTPVDSQKIVKTMVNFMFNSLPFGIKFITLEDENGKVFGEVEIE